MTHHFTAHCALRNKLDDISLFFIEIGMDVNEKGTQSQSTLHLAQSKKMITALINAGADIESMNIYEDTPLTYHSRMTTTQNIKSVSSVIFTLLNYGANQTSKNKWNEDFNHYSSKYNKPELCYVEHLQMRRLPIYTKLVKEGYL